MRNTAIASVPLIIALVGGTTLGIGDIGKMRLEVSRLAVTYQDQLIALDDDQMAWIEEHNPYGPPESSFPGSRTLIVREGYSLAHNNVDLIADWVSYRLTREFVDGSEARPGTSYFKPDHALRSGLRAEKSDYKGWQHAYDRGHQCASGDSKGRGTALIRESFFLSNVTPQVSRLNQHKWRLLEARIQNLARTRGELWVITGPVFVDDDNDGIIRHYVLGKNQVAIPTHYYKIVFSRPTIEDDPDLPEVEAMSFLIPNETPDAEFEDYLVSIDEIERLTAIDFLPDLDNAPGSSVEAAVAPSIWGANS